MARTKKTTDKIIDKNIDKPTEPKKPEAKDGNFIFIRTYIGSKGTFIKNNKYLLNPEQQIFFSNSIKEIQ